jgi:hypothetical protein
MERKRKRLNVKDQDGIEVCSTETDGEYILTLSEQQRTV